MNSVESRLATWICIGGDRGDLKIYWDVRWPVIRLVYEEVATPCRAALLGVVR